MSKIIWDKTGERFYETGTDHGVLYPKSAGSYEKGVAWDGLTAVTESPEGAEPSEIWADNIKYLVLRSTETYGISIEAYQSPEEFDACDGTASIATGVKIGQQPRKSFGFTWRTKIGNDEEMDDYGYKLHIVYNCTASPSERSYATTNDSPEAMTLSWEVDTTPVDVPNGKPTACITIDSTKCSATALKALEEILYGTETTEPRLPSIEEVIEIFGTGEDVPVTGVGVTPSSATLEVGETVNLTASIVPNNATDKAVVWSSSSDSIATVSTTGVVTAVASGSATITATAHDGSGATDTCAVTVTTG